MITNEGFGMWAAGHPGSAARMQNLLPVSILEPTDISNAIAWLVAEEARYVTDVTLPVDAGFWRASNRQNG